MLTDILDAQTLRTLEAFKLQSRRKQLGFRQGGHISPRRGHGIEFSDYRNYELGDDPRHIDWGVYARSDRLYIKRFQEEQDLNIYLIIDNSPSIFVPAEEKKWSRLLATAFAIAYVALMQDDTVHFLINGERQPLACRSVVELHRIADMLLNSKGMQDSNKSWSQEILTEIYRMRFPGVAYVISDLLFEREEFFNLILALLAKNIDANVVRIAATSDFQPFSGRSSYFEAIDSENLQKFQIEFDSGVAKQYQQVVSEHYSKINEFLLAKGVGYSVFDPRDEVIKFVTSDLRALGINQC